MTSMLTGRPPAGTVTPWLLKARSGQSAPLLEVRSSAGAVMVSVTAAGAVKNSLDDSGFYTGADDDLRLHHNGTFGFLACATSHLFIDTVLGDIFMRAGGNQNFQFYTNGLQRGYCTGAGTWVFLGGVINQGDNLGYYTGASNDLRLFHNGTSSLIVNATGDLLLQTTQLMALYTNGSTLALSISSVQQVFNPVDNAGFYTGLGNDLRSWHNGTDSLLDNLTGKLILKNQANAALELWSNNTLRVSVGASGDTSFSSGFVKSTVDSKGFVVGAGDDCAFGHNGTASYLLNATGALQIFNAANAAVEFWTNSALRGAFAAGGLFHVAGKAVVGASSIDAAALFEVAGTTGGFLPPRMTGAERDSISGPPGGLMIYNTDSGKLNFFGSGGWEEVTSA